MRTRTMLFYVTLSLVVGVGAFVPSSVRAESGCSFTRDLELGTTGEDVRCLQRYLNGAGFVIADEGVGSPGHETNLYREKTIEAVKKWQIAHLVSPATGNWGPLSRALYEKLGTTPVVTPLPTTPTPAPTPTPSSTQSSKEKSARSAFGIALDAIETAQDDFDTAQDEGNKTGDAEDLLKSARSDFFGAVRSFLKNDYADAADRAEEARKNAKDAQNEIEGKKRANRTTARDEIDTAEGNINDAQDDVRRADRDGQDVGEADDLLGEAEDFLDDARNAFDDKDYSKVLKLTVKIKHNVEDALDSID